MGKSETRKKLSSMLTRLAPLIPADGKSQPLKFSGDGETVPMDSVLVLQLVLAIEEEFGITVEDGDIGAENFGDLESLCAFVESKLRAA